MTNSYLNVLPEKCISFYRGIDSFVLITKNVPGFVPVLDLSEDYIKSFNDGYSITPFIEKAMLVGATCGWHGIDITNVLMQGVRYE